MKKLLSGSAFGLLLLLCVSAAMKPAEVVEIEIVNPCNRNITYGWNDHTFKPDVDVDHNGSVDAGKTKKTEVPLGCYLKFARKNGYCSTLLGKVERKGQRFTVDCQ